MYFHTIFRISEASQPPISRTAFYFRYFLFPPQTRVSATTNVMYSSHRCTSPILLLCPLYLPILSLFSLALHYTFLISSYDTTWPFFFCVCVCPIIVYGSYLHIFRILYSIPPPKWCHSPTCVDCHTVKGTVIIGNTNSLQ